MRILLLVAILLVPQTLWAQTDKCPDEYKPCVIGSSTLRTRTPGPPTLVGEDGTYLGRLSSNPYDPESTSNPFGRFGSPYSPHSINNPYGKYGSPYSPYSATNPYATSAPKIVDPYLGRPSANPYAPDSTANPYGRYGSRFSPTSIKNPNSIYGSPFSPHSVTNPYATTTPQP